MFNVVLMTALSVGTESPDCHRRRCCPPPPPCCAPVVCCDAAPPVATDNGGTAVGDAFTDEQKNILKTKYEATDEEIKQWEKEYGRKNFDDLTKGLDEQMKEKKPSKPFTEEQKNRLIKDYKADENELKQWEKEFGSEGFDELIKGLDKQKKEGKPEGKLRLPRSATVVVRLPADSKIFIDGEPTVSTGERRVFVTPPLPTGRSFSYTLKVERVQDGVTKVVTETVKVTAGRPSLVAISFPQADVAQK